MNGLPPYAREIITGLIRKSIGQTVSIMSIVGDLRKQFPHLPVTESELTGIIVREALRVGRGVDFDRDRVS